MPATIPTTLHAYCFDIRRPDQAATYAELRAKLTAQGIECFCTHGGKSHYLPDLDGAAVDLETKHLFDNQWTTAPIVGDSAPTGRRVFDWAEDYNSHIGAPRGIKRGHYLDQTPAMAEVRRNTAACGYCGAQEPAAKGDVFCPHCLGSEYLKASDLHLTRMAPIDEQRKPRAPLSKAEQAHLLPLYRDAQLHGRTERDKKRIAAARAAVVATKKKRIEAATTEHDGMLWLMDHGIRTDNVIFYSHTGRFCFGWCNPVDAELLGELLAIISEFRFPYDIKTADGRTLSGER